MNTTLERTVTTTPEAATTAAPGLTERQVYNRIVKIAALEAQIKELTAARDALRAEVMGDAEYVIIKNDKFDLVAGKEPYKRFDSTGFKKDHPDLHALYTKDSMRSAFRYKIK